MAPTCTDTNLCTVEYLVGEKCRRHAINCDDGDRCTTDGCQPNVGCVYTKIACVDDHPCTDVFCSPLRGCYRLWIECDDGNRCTDEACTSANGCVTTPIECDDGDPCTLDSCDVFLGCQHTLSSNCLFTDLPAHVIWMTTFDAVGMPHTICAQQAMLFLGAEPAFLAVQFTQGTTDESAPYGTALCYDAYLSDC
ncbi:MAG: hypothetical protein HY543_12120, partial [Deltaproteobacteria bacterium]|nr:hypothetical protein [Deltaproteobacteria bacterium]